MKPIEMKPIEFSENTPLAALNIGQYSELSRDIFRGVIEDLTMKFPKMQSSLIPENFGKDDCSVLTGYSKNTINKMVCEKRIPHYKSGARVLFNRKEIMDWLLANRVPTAAEFVEAKEVEFTKRKK